MDNRKNLFVKWFIIFSCILTGNIIAGSLGLFKIIIAADISHLTQIIAALFLFCSLQVGKISYDLSRDDQTLVSYRNGVTTKLKRKLKFLEFMADSFFTLGLMGTIIGFCYMMRGTLQESADVSTIIAQLKVGSSTKLFTTLAGIVSSLLLQYQLLIVKNDLIGDKDEDN